MKILEVLITNHEFGSIKLPKIIETLSENGRQ